MNRKSGIFRFLLWTCIGIACNSCVFYKTVSVPVSSQSLLEHQFKRAKWTITDNKGTVRTIVPIIRNDSIIGNLLPIEKADHPKDSAHYKAKKGPYSKDYLHLYTKSPLSTDNFGIPISELTGATKHVKAHGLGIASSLGISTGVLVGGILIIALFACNCPHVSVLGTDTTLFQGSLFPGSISKSLERPDNLIMKEIPLNRDGNISIRISNELPEKEFFNQIELFEVRQMPFTNLGLHAMGNPVSYDLQDHLQSVVTENNRNIKDEIQSVNGGFYEFNEPTNEYDLNKVYLTFNRENLKDDAMLIVKAKQSKWMETVAAFTFQQFGIAFDKWIARLDKTDPKKYNQSIIDKGISMNAYVKRNSKWEYIGSYSNVGTLAYRNLALHVDVSRIKEKTVEIKLEAAHGFWDIDYVGMTNAWSENINLSKLTTISAVNHQGENVMQAIDADDVTYTELPTQGNFMDVKFEAPINPHSNFILKGKGYYHHERVYTTKPNYKFLKTLDQDKMATHQLSLLLRSHLSTASNNP